MDAAGWGALQHLVSVLLEHTGEPLEQEHHRLFGSPFFLKPKSLFLFGVPWGGEDNLSFLQPNAHFAFPCLGLMSPSASQCHPASATVGLIQSQLPNLAPLEAGSSARGVAALFAQLGYCEKQNKAKTLRLRMC